MSELKGKPTTQGIELIVDCPIHGEEQVAMHMHIGDEWSKYVCFKCYSEVVVEAVQKHQFARKSVQIHAGVGGGDLKDEDSNE